MAAQIDTPVLFGGEVQNGHLQLTEFVGTWTSGLNGLVIPPRSGLGGRVMDQLRAASVADYANSSSITHHYDGPVLGERIRSVLAVPVVVDGKARAVLYTADRGTTPIGDRTADHVIGACRRLATEIAIRDEVDRRLRMVDAAATERAVDGVQTEELRGIHAELRGIAQGVDDAGLQRRLRAVSERLARSIAGDVAPGGAVALSPRELDVLSQVALGCTNQQAAQRLSVGPETVKSYLRSAMAKLDVRSRNEAVVVARRLGLLP
ncbi:LuxR C-terminal-related transcriptional regulator [Antrihabitans sp. YC2-6]|uniref:LuxR C-terminal-related transcriptional regulator n=1 Tax=Antrihabitans sp. YC2-6 TaxID=2799498 RepID=UPI0018F49A3C|nr:LuxR C-terminal-related transcriptional regulator [Antrihabitans sp. YC2-6]MBJ8343259.1 helix-turn-helix transcriptional regulator [Antrihabitans sp. YC2-6]